MAVFGEYGFRTNRQGGACVFNLMAPRQDFDFRKVAALFADMVYSENSSSFLLLSLG